MNACPRVTVVMPSLNQGEFVELAILSIFDQGYPNLELIVADGGSADGTLPILERLAAEFEPSLQWTSEKDDGPASAINKALRLASGEVICWLNSDDLFTPGSIGAGVMELVANPELLMTYGEGELVSVEGTRLGKYPTLPPAASIGAFHEGCFICQPTVFLRREVFSLVGYFDESLQTAFDFEMWLRIFRKYPKRISHIDRLQARTRQHDGTITQRLRREVALEGMNVLARHVGDPRQEWLLTYVEELYTHYPFVDDLPDLKAHVTTLLDDAPEPAASKARKVLEADARLQTSLPGVFAAIQADGWAGQITELRIRLEQAKGRTLTISCAHQWPKFEPISLWIKPDWQRAFKLEVGSAGAFEICVALPVASTHEFLTLRIESEKVFTPQMVEPGSLDRRELAFKIESIGLT